MSDVYDLVVLGGGTGGLVSALIAAGVGARVALIERDRTGGDCLWTGCVPSKSLIAATSLAHRMRHADAVGLAPVDPVIDFARVMGHVHGAIKAIEPQDSPERLRKEGVEVVQSSGRFTGPGRLVAEGRELRWRSAIIATGSSPLIPPIPGLHDARPLTTETLWDLRELPRRLVVLGGGPVGCELAQAFARLGSCVTVVEMAERLLLKEEPRASELIASHLRDDAIDVLVGKRASAVRQAGGDHELAIEGSDEGIAFDAIIIAAGRAPRSDGLGLDTVGVEVDGNGAITVDRHLRTSARGIFAVGDVTGLLPFTHVAAHHARVATPNALFKARGKVSGTIPWVTFTDPEVGRVGLTEAQAQERWGERVKLAEFDYAEARPGDHRRRAGRLREAHRRPAWPAGRRHRRRARRRRGDRRADRPGCRRREDRRGVPDRTCLPDPGRGTRARRRPVPRSPIREPAGSRAHAPGPGGAAAARAPAMTDGEQWAAEQLDALRSDRFVPMAWARFLGASFRRAAENRRARPQLARQARTWSVVGVSADLAIRTCARKARVPAPRHRSFLLWWLSVCAMLDWHLGMVEGSDGERRERLSAADALTLLRLWLVPLLASQGNRERRSGPAFAVLIASAAGTDALDGTLARRAGTTRFGRDLDTLADALVTAAAARGAARAGWLPRGVARLAVIRSAAPAAYATGIYFRTGRRSVVDSLGSSRQLAPALLGGLAAAPFSRRAGAALTTGASAMSLGLVVVRPTVAYLARRQSRESIRAESGSRSRHRSPATGRPPMEERCHFPPSRSAASRDRAS